MTIQASSPYKSEITFGDELYTNYAKIRHYGSASGTKAKRLSIFTNNTAKMTIDSLGRIQIGNNIPELPEARFHIYESDVANTPMTGASIVIEKNTGEGYINFLVNSAQRGSLYFGDQTANPLGWLGYRSSAMPAPASAFEFAPGGSAKGFWGSAGMLSVGTMTTFTDAMGVINAQTGYRVNNLAVSGEFLRGNGTNFVSSAIQSSDIPNASISTAKLATGAVSGAAYGTVYYVPVDSINYDATTDLATYSEIHYYMYTGAGATANQVLTVPAASSTYAGKKIYVVSDDADQLDAYGLAVTSSSGATIRYYSGGDTGFSDNASYASFGHGEGPNAVLFVCVQNPRTLAYRWVAYDGIRGGY